MKSVYFDSLEVSFSSTVNLFNTWMEAIRVLESHNMQRCPHIYRKLESHLEF